MIERSDYMHMHRWLTERARELASTKSHDYGGKDVLGNIRAYEAYGVSMEKGIVTRLVDKLSRLSNFADAGVLKVKDESIQDTIVDIINYAVMYGCIVKERQDGQD